MKNAILFVLFLLFLSYTSMAQENSPIALVIHGGAGTILRENLSPEQEALYRAKLTEALDTGYAVLEEGGSSLDAVTATIQVLESSPLFNAGRGAVFTYDGKNELDASIMDGASGQAGAVAGVSHIKSPILAARAVMEKSPHVLLVREGAEAFAKEQGLEMVDPSYFFDQKRFDQLQRIREREKRKADRQQGARPASNPDEKFGTVGCVALDRQGNIAAGTSTGGMTNKRWGRVGDSPIIGAGTYASNATCGVSATGHGEFFIRQVVAYDIAARMKYLGESLEEASEAVVMKELKEIGGEGGVVALDRKGNISMPFNTAGMYRGYRKEGQQAKVMIYSDEK
jgi:beta-aspartyl-peptidase (threonine type)